MDAGGEKVVRALNRGQLTATLGEVIALNLKGWRGDDEDLGDVQLCIGLVCFWMVWRVSRRGREVLGQGCVCA